MIKVWYLVLSFDFKNINWYLQIPIEKKEELSILKRYIFNQENFNTIFNLLNKFL